MNGYITSTSIPLGESSTCTMDASSQRYQQYYHYVTSTSGEQSLVYIDPWPRWEVFIAKRFPCLSVKRRILRIFKSRVIEIVRQYHLKIFRHKQPRYFHKCYSLK